MSTLIESISGTRAVVGDSLTPALIIKMGMAFGLMLGKGPVVVGSDTRTSHEMVVSLLKGALLSVGTDVIEIGIVPTPTVQQLIRHHKAAGGMVATASHNPIIWNGIKLMNREGSFLNDAEYEVFQTYMNKEQFPLADWKNLGVLSSDKKALEVHVNKIMEAVDVSALKTSGLRVLVDVNNGTGALADLVLFEKLGVEYELLNAEPNGLFSHDPEPLKKNLSAIIEKMKTGNYDIGFVQDADADRLVILDETGEFIGEDYSLGFCIDYILQQEKVAKKEVVVNLSTSQVIEDIAKKHGATVVYTKIGETNVTQKLKQLQAVVGGEGNGGVIYPKVGWGRDSLVGIVIALKYLAESKKKVSEIVKDYPRYVMLREKIQVSTKDQVKISLDKIEKGYGQFKQNTEDGVKVWLAEGWLHVRPSNTEPIIRVFIEAPNNEKAQSTFEEVMAIVK